MPHIARVTPTAIALTDPLITTLIQFAQDLHAAVAMALVRFRIQGADPNVYEYRLESADGRTWEQVMSFTGPIDEDPATTFNVPGAWKLSEFTHQRDLRSMLLRCRVVHAMTEFRVTWGD